MKNALFAYQNTEKMTLPKDADANSVLLVVMEELIKSVKSFHKNISIKSGDIINRSKNFSRAISVIYMLQSSLDLDKGGQIAYDLFRLYEFLRSNLIKDLRNGTINKSLIALTSIIEIKNSWSKLTSN